MIEIRTKFDGGCLKRIPPTILHGGIINVYIVYEITNNFNASNYPALENCLFGSIKLTKHVDINQHEYSGYGIGFDRKGLFSMGNEIGRNVKVIGVDMSSSKKDILILGKGRTQGLEHTLSAEIMYSTNFTEKKNKTFCLSMHLME